MGLIVTAGRLKGILRIDPPVFRDARGLFSESYRLQEYTALGLPTFVQENMAVSRHGVLRGLHFQHPQAQGKLVQVLEGTVFDVAVDLRTDSATFGQWEAYELSADNLRQLYVPPGFAHGYQALTNITVVTYKCTACYDPLGEFTLAWDDPALNIDWPILEPVCSQKDSRGLTLSAVPFILAAPALAR